MKQRYRGSFFNFFCKSPVVPPHVNQLTKKQQLSLPAQLRLVPRRNSKNGNFRDRSRTQVTVLLILEKAKVAVAKKRKTDCHVNLQAEKNRLRRFPTTRQLVLTGLHKVGGSCIISPKNILGLDTTKKFGGLQNITKIMNFVTLTHQCE